MASPFIGRKLGKYEIVELIAQGGMASVYKGYHSELDRYIAIKVLPPHPGRDPEFDERFRLEAHTIARLQHPNILSLYDYGTEDDILYLAMAFVDGGALSDLLTAGPLPLPRAEKILREVAAALDYAHRRDVIHRDIKPGNILLDSEGHALLADFGIAKIMGSSSTITNTGSVVGTPAYMAPEQSQAEAVDRRADIYSLGVVLYEMLTGEQPYISTNPLRVIIKHINDPIPRITLMRRDLPPALEVVMQRVMAKAPNQRYQTARDFYEAFSQALHSKAISAPADNQTAASGPQDSAAEQPDPLATVIFDEDASVTVTTSREQVYTFLFTDIEGSTQLWEQQPEAMSAALTYHDTVMAQTIDAFGGRVFKTVGDGIYAVFDSANDALQAALKIQSLMYQATVADLLPLAIRMGLYTGQAELRAGDYFGTTLNRTSRLMDAAHGGQILLSFLTKEQLPSNITVRDLGMHRLRDVQEPEHIFQAVSPDFPLNVKPIRSLTPRPTNLPAQLTSFVGREQNLAEICQLLRQPAVRLLTLLGPGGIGKTRLSIQTGMNLLDEYEDGVFFIPLAPINQAEAIIKFITQALNIEVDPALPPLEALKAYLQSRQVLLIFDNFEHILDAAPLLNELLTAAARVKILATSRESLFIYGERLYTVPPLDLPEPGEDKKLLLRSAAGALFLERVQAMQPEFVLSAMDVPDVIRICRQLEGLPLALELAAARVRDLSLQQIAEQLSQRLALLSKGPRDLPMRQQTMRGAIEWSYQLLSPEEQRAFANLAVFEGQFFDEAAQEVAGIADLTVFLNKSLVQQPAEQIYTLLAVLREYALERLNDFAEEATMRQKHGLYYCQFLEKAEAHLNGRDQIAWFARVKVEQYNLQAALEWFLQQQEIENAGRLVGIMWRYWATQSLLNEGQHWSNEVLAHAEKLSKPVHARVAQGAGRLSLLLHDYARTTTLQKTSLALYQAIDDQAGQAAVLMSLGETEYVQANYVQAENYLGESLSLFRALDNEAGIGRCLNVLGKIVMQNGDFVKAEPILRESLALAREHGSSEAIGLALYDLAGALRALEKYAEAEDYYRQSLVIYQELDLTVGVATMLINLGFTQQGLGNQASALDHFIEALRLLQTLDEPIAIVECLIGVAGAFLHLDKTYLCIEILSAIDALLTALNAHEQVDYIDQAHYKRTSAAAAQGDADQWQAAWAAGQTTPLEQIIKEVLAEGQSGSTLQFDKVV